jgi:hypothetical protein
VLADDFSALNPHFRGMSYVVPILGQFAPDQRPTYSGRRLRKSLFCLRFPLLSIAAGFLSSANEELSVPSQNGRSGWVIRLAAITNNELVNLTANRWLTLSITSRGRSIR